MRRAGLSVARVALCLLALAGCTAGTSSTSPGPGALTASTCTAYSPPTSVADVNTLVAGFRDQPLARGGDVGADITLSDGRRLWVFGDTLRQQGGQSSFVRNSMLLFDDRCARVLLPAGRAAVIPDRPDGVGYWPMSIALTHRDGVDFVGVMSQRVRGTGAAGGFENLGPAIAVLRVQEGRLPVLVRTTDLGPDRAARSRPSWGAASWVDDDGYAYLYGTSSPDEPMVFGFALHVARVPVGDVLDVTRWRYWDGHVWQADPGRSSTLVPAVGGVSQTLSVFHRDGTWYAVSKRDEYLGTDLVIWTAPAPTGPFRAHETGVRLPSDLPGRTYRYMPLAHPDMPAPPGQLVVSYSQGSDDMARLAVRPEVYRPRFLQVPLPASP